MNDASKKPSLRTVLPRALKLGMHNEANWFWLTTAIGVIHGSMWAGSVIARQNMFDRVADVATGNIALSLAVIGIVIYTLVFISQQALNGLANFLTNQWLIRFTARMQEKLTLKAERIDPVQYESSEFLDSINKAREGSQMVGILMFISTGIFTFYLPYFLFLGIYLFCVKPMLSLSIVLVFIPVLLTQFIRMKVFANLEESIAPVRRQYEYFEKSITDRAYFKETRLLGSYAFLRRQFTETLNLFSKKSWKAEKKTFFWEMLMKVITLGGYIGILYMLFTSLLSGEISVGVFAAVFSEVGIMFEMMEEVICRHIGLIAQQFGTVQNFFSFMDAPERTGEEIELLEKVSLSLNDVSFRYPGAQKDALSHVSLSVKPGETIAIVGENGAGKSTIVRLLTGIYLPTSGKASICGHDTASLSPKSLFSRTSGVFQKFMRYRMTLSDNVTISDSGANAPIEPALIKGDLSASDAIFPSGGDTMLSREFEGIDLSGGQWQRVAIARGFYRTHGLIVLDEPTAAIDPLEETRVYRKFAELSRDKTAIIVTHRMGSARIADRILVMGEGRILQEGTHESLMQTPGPYADMVQAQALWYK